VVRDRGIDLIHGYEWPPILEAYLVSMLSRRRVLATGTVMSMSVAPFLPRTVSILVGTPQIAAAERTSGRQRVGVMEPPVDLAYNNAQLDVGVDAFIKRWDLDSECPIVVMVTRLANTMKLEGLLTAIDTISDLAADGRRLQLVIVGDGPARDQVVERVTAANTRCGRQVVVLTGEMADPRPAYAVADIVLGMGGSALRAMAFAKPIVVQGERGFFEALTHETVAHFLWAGWYGVGTGTRLGRSELLTALEPLLESERLRQYRGTYALDTVQHFSLVDAARIQLHQYHSALQDRPPASQIAFDFCRTTAQYSRFFIQQRWRRLRSKAADDDFNSIPVAAVADADQTRGDGR
jgi:hypothetical protein